MIIKGMTPPHDSIESFIEPISRSYTRFLHPLRAAGRTSGKTIFPDLEEERPQNVIMASKAIISRKSALRTLGKRYSDGLVYDCHTGTSQRSLPVIC